MGSYAAFGEVNYDLTEQLTATLGLRCTYEKRKEPIGGRYSAGSISPDSLRPSRQN